MQLHDFGLWLRYKVWENGHWVNKYCKPNELSLQKLKSFKGGLGFELVFNGQRISSIRLAKYLWIENLPHIYSTGDLTHLSAVQKDGLSKVENLLEQTDELIKALEQTKIVLLHMKKNEQENDKKTKKRK